MWGLFVLNHAKALQGQAEVYVLYIDSTNNATQARQPLFTSIDGVPVLYYWYLRSSVPVLGKLITLVRMVSAWGRGWRLACRKWGKPHLHHVHILTRMGLMALLLKWRHGIPYVITEHWSRYLPQNLFYKGVVRKWLTRKVVKHSGAVMPVSRHLQAAMEGFRLHNPNYVVVPNVVDTNVFFAGTDQDDREQNADRPFLFLHISTFDNRAKNIEGLLRSAASLAEHRDDFELRLVGDGADLAAMKKLAHELAPGSGQIHFDGAMEPRDVAARLRSADVLVLFSHYENLPVVVLEALCSGVPVLATRVGGLPELIHQGNGILVEPGDEEELAKAMVRMLDTGRTKYNTKEIQDDAVQRFSEPVIARHIAEVYRQVVLQQREQNG